MKNAVGRITVLGLIIGGAFCCAASRSEAASVDVQAVTGTAGSVATFTVTLTGSSVSATQNDIAYDSTNTPIGVTTSGNCTITTGTTCNADTDCPTLPAPFTGNEPCVNKNAPQCTVNSSISKGGFFSFLPNGCSGASCTSIRALILGLTTSTQLSEIPTGSVLYTCTANVAAGAADATYPLTVPAESVYITDTSGVLVSPATGTNGSICLGTDCGGCIGDKNGDRSITADETVLTINAFAQDDVSLNPAADGNKNGSVEANETVQVINNFAQDLCNPFTP